MGFAMTAKREFPVVGPRSNFVLVGRDIRGGWIVRDHACLRGGLFVDQDEACRYALAETGNCVAAVKVVQDVLTLTFD